MFYMFLLISIPVECPVWINMLLYALLTASSVLHVHVYLLINILLYASVGVCSCECPLD